MIYALWIWFDINLYPNLKIRKDLNMYLNMIKCTHLHLIKTLEFPHKIAIYKTILFL